MAEHCTRSQRGSLGPPLPELFTAQPPTKANGVSVITKILVANRGEIACRVIATCRKLGIKSVAVFVKEDRGSRHVDDADEAIDIGSIEDPMGNPFLDIDRLISTAKLVGAQAIHPGYGYLSENASFAQATRNAGLIFIGPSARAMSTLGDKRSSKEYLREHCPSVPLIPGYAGSSENIDALEMAAQEMGYPIMIKASAGGGGKGMRVVRSTDKFREELGRAQSEAQRSFGSQDCILETYIEAAKHIEVQIIGDGHGNVLSLWERECSVQRRHQKIIEETPCPWITQDKREEMCQVAVQIGQLLAYEGAGTVEFVYDVETSRFFFLEVNTRLQVEHPITEEVTRLDIVSLQIFVAAGGNLTSLSALTAGVPQIGHAIECRLCAEDAQSDFYPQNGLVRFWEPAEGVENVRYETALRTGASVSIHFDSLIAKVVVWAPTRSLAIDKMIHVLANTACIGIRTNLHFLQVCLAHEGFRSPQYTTSFIPNNLPSLLQADALNNKESVARKIPLIAYIFLLWLDKQAVRPFRNVRYGFRNQHHDPMSGRFLIMDSSDAVHKGGPILCTSTHSHDSTIHQVQMAPLSSALHPPEKQERLSSASSPALQISKAYNAISSALREGSFYSSDNPPAEVVLEHCEILAFHPGKSSSVDSRWIIAKLQVFIDGQKLQATVSSDNQARWQSSSQTGNGQHLFIHVPAIGTQVEYECFNLLSYFESLRKDIETSSDGDACTVKAPMPCKVLSVARKTGDEVRAGETIMVVESMKMEINIAAAVDGRLDVRVSKGDAVNEGTVLCSVEQVEDPKQL